MDKNEISSFFDKFAGSWDKNQVRNEEVIEKILCIAGIKSGVNVLDVACGTGILFGDYYKRNVSSVTAIDISENMVRLAKQKFPEADVICGDAETYKLGKEFDSIVIYNAFPHFVNDKMLIENLSSQLSNGGRLTIAHGCSREEIIECHKESANHVSVDLITAEELAGKMNKCVCVDTVISDSQMYAVSGYKK